MAVVTRRLLDSGVTLETYLPARTLGREEREQAHRLDEHLGMTISGIETRVLADELARSSIVRKWYLLGVELHRLASEDFVMQADVDSGDLWKALWWYLPSSLRPSSAASDADEYELGHKRKDHLSLCYEIAKNPWPSVEWIQRWDDWHQISFRPAVARDPRVLQELGRTLVAMDSYPDRALFRAVVRNLGERFPTRQMVNTEVLDDTAITTAVHEAVYTAQRSR
ncbi:MAG: hypothetical protein Kow0067_12670 [Coriobacteriia bacterium]